MRPRQRSLDCMPIRGSAQVKFSHRDRVCAVEDSGNVITGIFAHVMIERNTDYQTAHIKHQLWRHVRSNVEGNFNRVWRTNVSQDDQGAELPTLDLMTRYGTQNDTTKVTVF
jgi:hypothetical protein